MYLPKISIITATYNAAATLEQSICSVVDQTYRNIEYIIIDGGSTDGTVELIHKYEKQLGYFISEPDGGVYDAFNKGIKAASGDYIYFLGADDSLIDNDIIEKVVSHLTEDVDVLSANVYFVYEWHKYYQYIGDNSGLSGDYKGGMVSHQGLFIKSSFVKKYMFDTSYKIAADYKLLLQCMILEKARKLVIKMPVAYYSDAGISSTLESERIKENILIEKEFGLTHTADGINYKSKMIYFFKAVLVKIGVFRALRFYKGVKKDKWQEHHCNNRICRWCGRKA